MGVKGIAAPVSNNFALIHHSCSNDTCLIDLDFCLYRTNYGSIT
jgi:hypothetical protein